MGTPYPGFDPFTPSAQPATFGRWVTGLSCDDGDLDDAAVLNALPMADTDYAQFLGWRMIDIVSGGTYTFTTQIFIRNDFVFNGTLTVQGAQFLINSPTYLYGGKTLHVGDSGLGIGHIVVDGSGAGAGSSIVAQNGADIVVNGAGGVLNVGNGAKLQVSASSFAEFDNNPALNVDPGGLNRLFAANLPKAWVEFVTDGVGGLTVQDAYNVQQVTLSGTSQAVVTFFQQMATGAYVLGGSIMTASGAIKCYAIAPFTCTAAGFSVAACSTLDSAAGGSYVDITANPIRFRLHVIGRQ